MKKITTVLMALLLGTSFCLTACGGEEPSSQTPPTPPPVVEEKKESLVLTSSSIDAQAKEANFYAGEEYAFSVGFGADELETVNVNDVTVNLSGEGLTYTIKQKKIVVTAPSATTGKISVAATINGKSYESEEYAIKVVAIERIRSNATSYFLLAKEDLAGNTVLAENTTRQLSVYRFDKTEGEQEITAQATYLSSDPSIVTVDSKGKVTSVSSGSATITCSYADEKVDIAIDVYMPIYTAEDMDTLSLCTYNEDKETATKMLSQNYVLMNDIDYSTHVRNYILPIASPTIKDIHATISRANAVSGDCSYFSYGWKHVLGLTQKQGAQGEQYLENADGTPFKGINPNAVKFTGVFDGNGYAIKNAWLMLDNVLYLNGITSQNHGYTVGANCFIGYSDGIIRNLAFTDFTIGQTHDQIFTKNKTTGEWENKYGYYSNATHMTWEEGAGAMSMVYRSGQIPCVPTAEPTTYKSEINGTVTTAGYMQLHSYAAISNPTDDHKSGETVITGRSLWGSRPNAASALVFINNGSMENVYMEYFQAANLGLGIKTGAFTTENASTGAVKNCVAIVEVQLTYERQETVFNSGAVINRGLLENVSVAVAVYKRADYAIYSADTNTGTVIGCASYLDKEDFMTRAKNLDAYDANSWNKETMTLNQNVYGFVR